MPPRLGAGSIGSRRERSAFAADHRASQAECLEVNY
jgi:hypothetical protein